MPPVAGGDTVTAPLDDPEGMVNSCPGCIKLGLAILFACETACCQSIRGGGGFSGVFKSWNLAHCSRGGAIAQW